MRGRVALDRRVRRSWSLHRAGARALGHARCGVWPREGALRSLAQAVRRLGARAEAVVAELTDERSVDSLINRARNRSDRSRAREQRRHRHRGVAHTNDTPGATKCAPCLSSGKRGMATVCGSIGEPTLATHTPSAADNRTRPLDGSAGAWLIQPLGAGVPGRAQRCTPQIPGRLGDVLSGG